MESLQQVPGPPAGQPGHGSTASVRRLPVKVMDGIIRDGDTDMFELICPDCGDDGRDRAEVPAELQRLRGPFPTVDDAREALSQHMGLQADVQHIGMQAGE